MGQSINRLFTFFDGALYYAGQKHLDIQGTSRRFDVLFERADFMSPCFGFPINILHGLINIVQDLICSSVYPLQIWERSG